MVKVTLGEQTFTVPKMNIGQIEDLSLLDRADVKWPFQALAIIMKRSDPKIESVRDIECAPHQVGDAIKAVMEESGYKASDPNQKAPEQTGQS